MSLYQNMLRKGWNALKKVFTGIFTALFLTMTASPAYAADMQIKVEGVAVAPDVKPEIKNNRMMVPLRVISENLGANVKWSGSKITITKSDMQVILNLKSNAVVKNGKTMQLDVKPYLNNNRILVPLRFIAETFNCSIDFKNSIVSVEPSPFVLNGVKVKALQHEVYFSMGSIVTQINGSTYNEEIYNVFLDNKGSKAVAPSKYTTSIHELTSGAYYKRGQFDFVDKTGKSIQQFDLYTLSHSDGDPDVRLYDATENQWYLFPHSAVQSIYQFMDTASQNGFLTTISDTNP
ncbi:copper amine oxidase N-terminal domain-containing protein [Paenibacillus pasadenensis]|uniref:copper amine oxidase N-terminal domain-containing protein n=1 Tax=Paenibacillus pasadenensis TaxID=217090 RepID=UPI00203E6792|nr:copper amine oxidase N-terminal domain-containing protein [Paenibacillus pasadenensis]MCM3748673.1 copper amine oxidase N-terminal domain-containing protein [Paenibacillus pasadenensis]